jgi:hypothetical protein
MGSPNAKNFNSKAKETKTKESYEVAQGREKTLN